MSTPDQSDDHAQSDTPNFLVRAISGLAVSIRFKLLAAFLGVTLLMAGIAALGLETLRQSHLRTERLLHDQSRISYFNELYFYASNLISVAAAADIKPSEVEDVKVNDIFVAPGIVMANVSNNFLLFTGHGLRNFGKQGMPDEVSIADFRAEAKRLDGIARRVLQARHDGDYRAAGIIARQEFAPIAIRLQGNAFSKVKEIEAEMAETAKSTALAYASSRQTVTAWTAIAVGLALLLGYTISSSLVWPVQRIGQTLKSIANGQFDTRVEVPNRDELGELAQNVNTTSARLDGLYRTVEEQRAELEVEHARSENLLNSLLPAQIAARLKNEPDQQIADSLPMVAILFADIVNFTPRSASMEPQEIVSFLNRIFSSFDALTEKHGLEKIKTIGDAYMVTAGMPDACDNPVQRLAAMALEMIEVSKSLPDNVELRIGLHAGPAVAGVIGNRKPFYDVWGDTVNTASRLESHGVPGRIQVTSAVREQLDGQFTFDVRGTVDVTGIGPIETWWLTGRPQNAVPENPATA